MKLVYKFALWYLAITSLVLLAGGVMVFYQVQREIDEEEVRRLRGIIEDVADSIATGNPIIAMQSNRIQIQQGEYSVVPRKMTVKDTMGWHSTFQGTERMIKVSQVVDVEGERYRISASGFAPEPEETIAGVIQSLSSTFVLLLVFVALTSLIISNWILSPFNKSLQAMRHFNLKSKKEPSLPVTSTKEFRTLNSFLKQMTTKALHDYHALKEFSENASHELQTPLAIIRGKLELLLESDITNEQARLIMAAHEAVEKLSRTNQALTLLTKLENREFLSEPINFSIILEKALSSLIELIEMKSISLTSDIQPGVTVKLHPSLADILLTNVLSNAIRHNSESGYLHVSLTNDQLVVKNSGAPPQVPTHQLFQRFKKNLQSSDSVGLGLSIVKRICDISGLGIGYVYQENAHIVTITFQKQRD